jgi:hypothetical protein
MFTNDLKHDTVVGPSEEIAGGWDVMGMVDHIKADQGDKARKVAIA